MAMSCLNCGSNKSTYINPIQQHTGENGAIGYIHNLCILDRSNKNLPIVPSLNITLNNGHKVNLSLVNSRNSKAALKKTATSQRSKIEDVRECTACGTEFSRKYEYQRHMNSVHGEVNYLCNIAPCENKPFSRKDGLQRHERTAHNMG